MIQFYIFIFNQMQCLVWIDAEGSKRFPDIRELVVSILLLINANELSINNVHLS